MYIPDHFREQRLEVLQQTIRQHSLATLVSLGRDGLTANHVPLVLDADSGKYGTLRGHLAKANPQWRDLVAGVLSLAIFQGAQAYITPSAYPSRLEHGRVVPTFNYVVVHAYGTLQVVEDEAWLLANVRALTNQHEAEFPQPWSIEDAPEAYIASLLKGIVGIEIPIARLEGKWKVSQNRSQADRAGVASELKSRNDPAASFMADHISNG